MKKYLIPIFMFLILTLFIHPAFAQADAKSLGGTTTTLDSVEEQYAPIPDEDSEDLTIQKSVILNLRSWAIALGGLGFAGWFLYMVFKKNPLELKDHESQLFETLGTVNNSNRGKVFITDQRVVFKPPAVTFRGKTIEIPIDQIKEIQKFKGFMRSFGFTPYDFLIQAKSGEEYKFVVNGRKKFLRILNEQLQKTLSEEEDNKKTLQEDKKSFCPFCAEKVAVEDVFCPGCGKKVSKSD